MTRPDPWQRLRQFTMARIAQGRAGASLPTAELLRFELDHARARDAVQRPFDPDALAAQLRGLFFAMSLRRASSKDRCIDTSLSH